MGRLLYIDHRNPRVAEIKAAQDILIAAYSACAAELRRNRRAPDHGQLRRLLSAVDYLALQVKNDPACWRVAEVA